MRTRSRSALRQILGMGLVAATALATSGCAVANDDLERWQTTLEGPRRLSAVVLFEKYDHDLRVKAAKALIDMKPRKGQQVGLERLVRGTLVCDPTWVEQREGEPCRRTQLSPESRAKILADLIPRMIDELKKPPPTALQTGETPADPSYPYKDAAYLILTYDKTEIIEDRALKQRLLDAMTAWAMIDFERKLNDRTQMFGMEQVLRLIGPTSVEGLPGLMTKESKNLAAIAGLVAKLGSTATKENASKKLVEIMTYTASEQWRKDSAAQLKEANDKAGYQPKEPEFKKQLDQFQSESKLRVFSSMKSVGGSATIDYCLSLAEDGKQDVKMREAALAAIERNIDPKDEKVIQRLFALAMAVAKEKDGPPTVIDGCFRRFKELPRDMRGRLVKDLYTFFDLDNWQVRRLAGATVLAMSKAEHIPEFLGELGKRIKKNFNVNEARTYAAYLVDLKEGNPFEQLKPFMKEKDKDASVSVRVTALSYFLVAGTKKDIDAVKPYLDDKQKVGKCESDATECNWECYVTEGKQEVKKEVTTVGELVQYCIIPKLQRTEDQKDPKKDAKKEPTPERPPEENPPGND